MAEAAWHKTERRAQNDHFRTVSRGGGPERGHFDGLGGLIKCWPVHIVRTNAYACRGLIKCSSGVKSHRKIM